MYMPNGQHSQMPMFSSIDSLPKKVLQRLEATIRSIKHPFRNGKVPVRGQARVSMVMLGSAAMSNLRRVQNHLVRQDKARRAEKADEKQTGRGHYMPAGSLFVSFLARLRNSLRPINLLQPVLAQGI